MPIVHGADLTPEELEQSRVPVINVVAGQQTVGGNRTVGAGCYPIPMYPFVPQVYPSPLPIYWSNRYQNISVGTTSGQTVGNRYLFHNPASTYEIPMYHGRPGTAYPPLPTYWMGRPRAATASPLTTPFPVTNMCGPKGPMGFTDNKSRMDSRPFPVKEKGLNEYQHNDSIWRWYLQGRCSRIVEWYC